MSNTDMSTTVGQAASSTVTAAVTSGVTATSITSVFPGMVTGGVTGSYSTVNVNSNSNQSIWSISPSNTYATFGTGNGTSNILTINDRNSKELVRIEHDGKVVWRNDATIDEATESFCNVLQFSAERCAGITTTVKQRIRDIVFDEIIEIAKEKGSLNADELTFMLRSIKIMDKLKDIK